MTSQRSKSVNIKIHPLGLLSKTLEAGVDYAVCEKISLGVRGSYFSNPNLLTRESSSYAYSGYSLGLATSYYVSGMNHSGFFMTAQANLAKKRGHLEDTSRTPSSPDETKYSISLPNGSAYSLEGIGGYNYLWDNGFNIGVGFGMSYSFNPTVLSVNKIDSKGETSAEDLNLRFLPVAELTLGFML